ncbi:hypothetical protein FXO37_26262 [Capsicum annuum]|nr:hypothetical protein FXO37_26262 [Capsicum annuum]
MLLKIRGVGTPRNNKKREFDEDKSTTEEPKSCRPSVIGPLEDIGVIPMCLLQIRTNTRRSRRHVEPLWLGLRGDIRLWNSLTETLWTPTTRVESDDEALIEWSDDDASGDDVKSAGESSP